MKVVFTVIMVMCSSSFANVIGGNSENDHQDLISAITLCNAAHNPLTGLTKLGGNVFGEVNSARDKLGNLIITSQAISSPNSVNKAVMTADTIVGEVTVTMSYQSKGPVDRVLVCALNTKEI